MRYASNIACPVSPERVDENVARLIAAQVLFITIAGLLLRSELLMGGLAIDFALRTFGLGRYSPTRSLARWIAGALSLKPHLTDAAPKKFAAGIGMVFSTFIAFFLLMQWSIPGLALGVVLVACALLESAFNFCVGCYVYTVLLGRWVPWARADQAVKD